MNRTKEVTFDTVLIDSASSWNQTNKQFILCTLYFILVNSSRWTTPAPGWQLLTRHQGCFGPLCDIVLGWRTDVQESHEDNHSFSTTNITPADTTSSRWSGIMNPTKVSLPGLRHAKFLQVCVRLAFRLFIYSESAVNTRTVLRGTSLFLHHAASSLPSVLWSCSTLCRAAPFITRGAARKLNGASERSCHR